MKKLKQIGINARRAFLQLNKIDSKRINKVLDTYNGLLLKNKKKILKENAKDVKFSTKAENLSLFKFSAWSNIIELLPTPNSRIVVTFLEVTK